VYTQSF